jgi:putative restriction endonuclease
MSGIVPHGSSIVLSGGYVDDEDLGDMIIYTGEGGRDAATGRQIC